MQGEDGSVTNELQMADKIKSKENVKEFTAKPFRITCRKDLTSVLKRITSVAEFAPTEPILKFEHLENSPNAYQQSLVDCRSSDHNDSTKVNRLNMSIPFRFTRIYLNTV